MKSSFFKKFAALAVAVVMSAGMATSALAGGGGSTPATNDITVDVGIVDPVYNVTIPGTTKFAINPYSIATTGTLLIPESQISGVSNLIENRTTQHGVQVTLEFKATPKSPVALVAANSANLTSGSSKSMYLAVVGANAASGGGLTASDLVYAPAADGTQVAFGTTSSTVTSSTAVIEFRLAKFVTALASSNIAGYTFYGLANAEADWKADDVTVTGAYTLKPMNDTKVAATEVKGLNVMAGGLGPFAAFVAPANVTASLSGTKLTVTLNAGYSVAKMDIPVEGTVASFSPTSAQAEYKFETIIIPQARLTTVWGWNKGDKWTFTLKIDNVDYTVEIVNNK